MIIARTINPSTNEFRQFTRPDDNIRYNPLIDYELGGIALQNATQGLRVQWWKAEHDTGSIVLTPLTSGSPVTILTGLSNVTEVSLAFDKNMQPHIAYVSNGNSYLWWFNTSTEQMEHRLFSNMTNPRLTLDIHTPLNINNSDIVLAYTNGSNLYCRMQRDRFDVEYLLKTVYPNVHLNKVGINTGNRLQYEIY